MRLGLRGCGDNGREDRERDSYGWSSQHRDSLN
jgi:hypothetical protein